MNYCIFPITSNAMLNASSLGVGLHLIFIWIDHFIIEIKKGTETDNGNLRLILAILFLQNYKLLF